MNSILYGVTATLLLISWMRDRKRTAKALVKAWKAFENILPQILIVLLFVGVLLTILDTETIVTIIGDSSGLFGVLVAAVVGSITLIPGFVAFPTAALLLSAGAGYMQIAAFISTLMMVGVVTFPVERAFFSRSFTLYRNAFAFLFSCIVAFVIAWVVAQS